MLVCPGTTAWKLQNFHLRNDPEEVIRPYELGHRPLLVMTRFSGIMGEHDAALGPGTLTFIVLSRHGVLVIIARDKTVIG